MELSKSSAMIVIVLTAFLIPFSPNMMLVLASGVLLSAAILILWTERDLPILLFPFGMQWLSVATKPMLTGIHGVDINTLAQRGAQLDQSAWFAIFGLIAVLIGLRLGCRPRQNVAARLQFETRIYSPRYVVAFALALILVGHISLAVAGRVGGLYQAALVMGDAKYAGIFLLVYSSIKLGDYRLLAISVCAIEIVIGMMGFFGAFKSTLFMILLGVLLSQNRTSLKNIFLGASAAAFALTVTTFWSAVKTEYRSTLNQGTHQQVVSISITERLDFLSGAATNADAELLNGGLDASLRRVSYIDFLGHTMEHVPEIVPHQSGRQTLSAVRHVVTPRFVFPNKPRVPHDTYVTAAYTGLTFSQAEYASISIGYLGEFYIDFGYWGALLSALILGFGVAKIYETILLFERTPLFVNIALSIVAIMPFIAFEKALIKLIGTLVTYFVVILIFQRVVLPYFVSTNARRKRRPKGPRALIARTR